MSKNAELLDKLDTDAHSHLVGHTHLDSELGRASRLFQTSLDPENCPHTVCIQSQLIIPAETNELGVVKPGSYARVISVNNDPHLTRQADHDKACIHKILEVYKRSGHLPISEAQPLEGDVLAADDYLSAMNLVASVNGQFSMLPSEMRERFGNNPQNLLRFAANEKNHAELVEMGLARAIEAPQAPPVPPVVAPTEQAEGGTGGA